MIITYVLCYTWCHVTMINPMEAELDEQDWWTELLQCEQFKG